MIYKILSLSPDSKYMNPFHKGIASQDEMIEEFWALKDINFEIGKSETVAVIGRNSAGGSGLLKVDFQRLTLKAVGYGGGCCREPD